MQKCEEIRKAFAIRIFCKVCDFYFGDARQKGGSHRICKTPWRGDPRVNIQNHMSMAKSYQVRQVLRAIERIEANDDAEK